MAPTNLVAEDNGEDKKRIRNPCSEVNYKSVIRVDKMPSSKRIDLLPSCTKLVRGRLINNAIKMTIFCIMFIWMTSTAVDGFLIPHRKDEVPDDLIVQQLKDQLGSYSSKREPELKKAKKGISVNVVNVHVNNDQSDSNSDSNSNHNVVVSKPVSSPAQCNATAEKVDCASYGVTAAECLSRGCCYSEIRDGPDPWCYLPETSLVSQCQGREESRLQCGYYNIERDECNKLGCCWRPTSTSGTPWCYHADSDTSETDSDGGSAESASIECGVTPIEPNVNLRIVGGVEAVPHSWPWMVSLQRGDNHNCGGSLINDRWVISAAHCNGMFDNSSRSGTVVIGVHSLDSPDSTFTERIGVEKIIVHSKFLRPDNGISNDVMLIKLARPVSFNRVVRPICLPRHHQTIESGTRCWSTGWGTMESGAFAGSNVLNQVVLPLLDNTVCNQPEWYNNQIDDTMICAGYQEGGRDSCQGDSGGPLVCNQDGKWILYGIVSWGHGCAGANKPGLYARTSAYVKWINGQIRANSD